MIEVYSSKNCHSCSIAKTALQMFDIEFVEKEADGSVKGGLPLIINTKNGKKYNGWPGSIYKLKEILGC